MATSTQTTVQAPRIDARDLRAKMEAGQAVTVLDARAAKAWAASDKRIRGDVRVDPEHFHADPSWPKEQLTVVY